MEKEEIFYIHSGLIKVKGKKKPFRATAAGVVAADDKLLGGTTRVLHIGVAECSSEDVFVKKIGRNKAHGRALATGDKYNNLKALGLVANILLSPNSDARKIFHKRAVDIFNSLGKVYWFKTDLKGKTYDEVQLEEKYTKALAEIHKQQLDRANKAAMDTLKTVRAKDDGPVYDPDEVEDKVEKRDVLLDISSNYNHQPEY